jgi:haloalkane dehalogenase
MLQRERGRPERTCGTGLVPVMTDLPEAPPRDWSNGFGRFTAEIHAEFPFASRFHWLGPGRGLHYLDEGPSGTARGGPILCLHGNPTWCFAFRRIVRDFSANRRVIALDHLGCGFSSKPADAEYRLAAHVDRCVRFVRGLDLRDATLVAHDWGGVIGLGAVLEEPRRFSRLVLMNTAGFRGRAIPWRIALCRVPGFGALTVRGGNLFARAALTMAVERRLPAAVRAGYLAPYDSWANRVALLRFVQDIPRRPGHPSWPALVSIEERLERLREMPILLAWGMKDWCFTPWYLQEFRRRFPQAAAAEFAGAGHYLFEDADVELRAALRVFLDGAEPAAA